MEELRWQHKLASGKKCPRPQCATGDKDYRKVFRALAILILLKAVATQSCIRDACVVHSAFITIVRDGFYHGNI